MDAIARVREMEARMDEVRGALRAVEAAEESVRVLIEYYESGLWLRDYERDEAGGFPPDLKRGVLSQDGLYDLLADWDRLHREGSSQGK